jgi:hypothetical protein
MPRWLGAVEECWQELVIVLGHLLVICEGFMPSLWEITKGNSSGLLVACESPSCVGCMALGCGLGM